MNEKWKKSYSLITKVLRDNELGDAYFILKGYDLMREEHFLFWKQVVEYIKKYEGVEKIAYYVSLMEQFDSYKFLFYMNEIDNDYDKLNFVLKYQKFLELLSKVDINKNKLK